MQRPTVGLCRVAIQSAKVAPRIVHAASVGRWNAPRLAGGALASAHRSFTCAPLRCAALASNRAFCVPKRFLSEVRVGDDYEKGQEDESTTLTMEPPFGHDENEALAQQLGIYKVWEYEDGGKKSMFTMAYQSRAGLEPEMRTLEKFLAADNEMKLKQVPSGTTQNTSLPSDVTQYFSSIKIPFEASIFKTNMEGASDSLVFCFETPGGFWTIAWHVPAELFMNEPDLFFLFLQTIRLKPKNAQ